jgi:hypothetical protein
MSTDDSCDLVFLKRALRCRYFMSTDVTQSPQVYRKRMTDSWQLLTHCSNYYSLNNTFTLLIKLWILICLCSVCLYCIHVFIYCISMLLVWLFYVVSFFLFLSLYKYRAFCRVYYLDQSVLNIYIYTYIHNELMNEYIYIKINFISSFIYIYIKHEWMDEWIYTYIYEF